MQKIFVQLSETVLALVPILILVKGYIFIFIIFWMNIFICLNKCENWELHYDTLSSYHLWVKISPYVLNVPVAQWLKHRMSCVYNFTQPSAFIYNPAPAACCWEQSWRGEGEASTRASSVSVEWRQDSELWFVQTFHILTTIDDNGQCKRKGKILIWDW